MRFQVLDQFGGAAVLDKETGRVWERSPSTTTRNWNNALRHCYTLEVGGRLGWRLPTIEELASLLDPNSIDQFFLPPGDPFILPTPRTYWSATTNASNPNFAWRVRFLKTGEDVTNPVNPGPKNGTGILAWCVRGGQGIDGGQ